MRLDPLKSTLDTSINPDKSSKKPGLAFVDAFQEAVNKVNTSLTEADKAGLELSSGKNANIHEAMLQMQKANIEMSLMVTTVNKLIEAYNQLQNLR